MMTLARTIHLRGTATCRDEAEMMLVGPRDAALAERVRPGLQRVTMDVIRLGFA